MQWLTKKSVADGGLIFALVLLSAVGIASGQSLTKLLKSERLVEHTYIVLKSIGTVDSGIKDAERGRRGYVLTKEEEFLATYQLGLETIQTELPRLQAMIRDSPQQIDRFELLQPLIDRRLSNLEQSIVLLETDQSNTAIQIALTRQDIELQNHIQALLEAMKAEEQILLRDRNQSSDANVRYTVISLIAGYLLGFSLLIAVYYLLQKHIRDRQHIAQEIEDKQRFIEQIADTTPNILYIYDISEGRNIYTNGFIAEVLGYSDKAIQQMGKTFFERLVHPEDLQKIKDQHQTLITTEQHLLEVEYRMQAADGSWRWFNSRDTVFSRTAEGVPTQILGTAQDITTQRQTAAALQQANQTLIEQVNELQRLNDEIMLLNYMSDLLQACITLDEAYKVIAQVMLSLFPDCSGGVFVISESRNLAEAVSVWGNGLGSQTIFSPHECVALRRGQPHLVENMHTGLCCQHLIQPLPTTYFCIPMMAQGEATGILYLSFAKELNQAKRQLAVTVSRQVSMAVANLKLRETLQHQSIRDPLTGLFNRRYLEESLDRELHRAHRKQQSLGVIMLDIDHFKRFNDTFGHEAGDAVLREVGLFLRNSVRDSDIACRYGGEELTLVLPETSLENTQARAEKIRLGIKHLNVQHRNQSLGTVTASLGVACFPQQGFQGSNLIQAADNALYIAKANGRDRVVVAHPVESIYPSNAVTFANHPVTTEEPG